MDVYTVDGVYNLMLLECSSLHLSDKFTILMNEKVVMNTVTYEIYKRSDVMGMTCALCDM